MKILYASPEVVPFAKTGGLADVAGALPKAIKQLGHDIRVILPKFSSVDENKLGVKSTGVTFTVKVGDFDASAEIFEAIIPESDVIVYLVGNDKYFKRKEFYTENGSDYSDNPERFTFFCKAVLEFLKIKDWQPDIVHCNDWQTAMLAAYISILKDPFYSGTATVYSIHNMAYNGAYPAEKFQVLNIDQKYFYSGSISEWDKLVFAKAGFTFANVISTVSETYSKEIQTEEFGCGLSHVLKKREKDIYGILNGIDYSLWDPVSDRNIFKRYSAATISLKLENKLALQSKYGLRTDKSIPVIGIVSRLCEQKGIDIFADAIDEIVLNACQLVILGTGDPKFHQMLTQAKNRHKKEIGLLLGFDSSLAQLIYAGSDIFIMPSKYEPCGLGQLISFKYGTIPLVRKTGGLADTVQDINFETGDGNGFVFEEYSASALASAVKRSVECVRNNALRTHIQKKIMAYDYSWSESAKKYISLYIKAIEKRR